MDFEQSVEDWKAHDQWEFADKEAAWGFFFMAGRESKQRGEEMDPHIDGVVPVPMTDAERGFMNGMLGNEMNRTDDLPDGFYLLKNAEEPNVSLVRLYGHPDFDGVRHIAFGPWDGAALMPVWDLRENSTLTPAVISAGDTPTCDLDALVHNA